MWQTVYEMQRPLVEWGLLFNLFFAAIVFFNLIIVIFALIRQKDDEEMPWLLLGVASLFTCVALWMCVQVPLTITEKEQFYDRIEAGEYDEILEGNAVVNRDSYNIYVNIRNISDETFVFDKIDIPERCRVRLYIINEYDDFNPEDIDEQYKVRLDVYSESGSQLPAYQSGANQPSLFFPWKNHHTRNVLYMMDLALVLFFLVLNQSTLFCGLAYRRLRRLAFFDGVIIGFLVWSAFCWYFAVILSVLWVLFLRWAGYDLAKCDKDDRRKIQELQRKRKLTDEEREEIELYLAAEKMQEQTGRRTIFTLVHLISGIMSGFLIILAVCIADGSYILFS